MEITGKVHCLFEQSGTFKNQFRALIDKDRSMRKIESTRGGNGKNRMMARSEISPVYARNFICDFLIGKRQEHTENTLFIQP